MKKIEVKKLGPLSLFKVMLYMVAIPMAIFILIGLITILVGIFGGGIKVAGMGVFIGIGYPLMIVIMYGIFGTLMALVYNWLAGIFGGLELTIEETDSEVSTVNSEEE